MSIAWLFSPPARSSDKLTACKLPDFVAFLGWKSLCRESQRPHHSPGKNFCSLHHLRHVRFPLSTLKSPCEAVSAPGWGQGHGHPHTSHRDHVWRFLEIIMGFGDIPWSPCKIKSSIPSSPCTQWLQENLQWRRHYKELKVVQTTDKHFLFWKRPLLCHVCWTRAAHHEWAETVPAESGWDCTHTEKQRL